MSEEGAPVVDVRALTVEKQKLERLIAARDGKGGYGQNVIYLKARLAWIEQELEQV